ncbi:unnamed protein product [Prorocentrum cordatum]|uniref:Galectin n=1 Tax=Prorocentrum cordatum TaxID=2364126 RepID=A0ABN9TW37_9DINO|nr:unnamed protein product [Polarella glacialis]
MSTTRWGGGVKADRKFDDVQVLGAWNFTLQGDTPLFWIKSGALDSYLLQFTVSLPYPGTAGLVLHADQDGTGADGVSFWIERRPSHGGREGNRRYMLAGDGLDSQPVATRGFADPGGAHEEFVEVLVQGYNGHILLQDRKMRLSFRARSGRGCLAFYNSTQAENDDVHFNGVRVTALRKGPLEISGLLGRREHSLLSPAEGEEQEAAGSTTLAATSLQEASSWQSTAAPGTSRALTGTQGFHGVQKGVSSPAGGSRRGSSGALRASASDGLLQGAGASALGLRSAATGVRQKKGPKMGAFALNAPAGERQLLASTAGARKAPSSTACVDFIAM